MKTRNLSKTVVAAAVMFITGSMMVLTLAVQAQQDKATGVSHDLIGVITKLDSGAKRLVLKTPEGVETSIRFTEKTTVSGIKEGTSALMLAGREGTHVVVHYTGEGTERTAVSIDHIGKDAPKVMEGSIARVDKGSRTLVVKTASGTEETVALSERATIDTAKGSVKMADFAAKDGEHVTVHYTVEGTRKIGHFFKVVAK